MRHVVLPTARTGLLTAVILGVARVVGETAPLILTSLGNTSFNGNPFKGKQDALPLFIYRLIRFPQAGVDPTRVDRRVRAARPRARALHHRPDHRRPRPRSHRPHQARCASHGKGLA